MHWCRTVVKHFDGFIPWHAWYIDLCWAIYYSAICLKICTRREEWYSYIHIHASLHKKEKTEVKNGGVKTLINLCTFRNTWLSCRLKWKCNFHVLLPLSNIIKILGFWTRIHDFHSFLFMNIEICFSTSYTRNIVENTKLTAPCYLRLLNQVFSKFFRRWVFHCFQGMILIFLIFPLFLVL